MWHKPTEQQVRNRKRLYGATVSVAVLLFSSSSPIAYGSSELVQARWKPARIAYTHRGFNAAYECNTIDDLIRIILVQYGAHPGTRVELRGCPSGYASQRFGVVVMTAIPVEHDATPVETAEVEEITKRLGLGTADEVFAAHRQTVRLEHLEPKVVTGFHCELVENLAKHLFPALGIHTSKSAKRCAPGYSESRVPALEADVLLPLF